MNLVLRRQWYTPHSTIGELFTDGTRQCFTLEDVRRPPLAPKVPGATAIPAGRYRVLLRWSKRFQAVMPWLKDVPGFEGVLIHPGNDAGDTAGCILVGTMRLADRIGDSRTAYKALYAKLDHAIMLEGDEIWIDVIDEPPVAEVVAA